MQEVRGDNYLVLSDGKQEVIHDDFDLSVLSHDVEYEDGTPVVSQRNMNPGQNDQIFDSQDHR